MINRIKTDHIEAMIEEKVITGNDSEAELLQGSNRCGSEECAHH
jgi:hypothetical protein